VALADLKRVTRNGGANFLGACLHTGAQRCVFGRKQARAYCDEHHVHYRLTPSNYSFRFGDGLHASLGSITINIPTPNGRYITGEVDVISADVPLLFGLNLLDTEGLVANNVVNELQCIEGWTLPITRKLGHLYLQWNYAQVLFTRNELRKLHLQFYHPSARKLFELLKRARPVDVGGNTLETIRDIARACATFNGFRHHQRDSKCLYLQTTSCLTMT